MAAWEDPACQRWYGNWHYYPLLKWKFCLMVSPLYCWVSLEEAGIVEKRFIRGDINGNTEGKIMTKKNTGQNEVPVKTKKREKS